MEQKEISITICDECMGSFEVDTTKRITIRTGIYYASAVVTVLFLSSLMYWTYFVLNDMNGLVESDD